MAEITLVIDFRDLSEAGLSEEAFRGAPAPPLRTRHWIIPAAHREALRPRLEAEGFDPENDVWAQEMLGGQFRLTQYPVVASWDAMLDEPTRQPFSPGPLNPHLVHWPIRVGREELMIETLPEMRHDLAEYLVRELLTQSGLETEEPDAKAAALEVRLGVPSIRMATMNFSVEGTVYVVTLTRDRVSVLPYRET